MKFPLTAKGQAHVLAEISNLDNSTPALVQGVDAAGATITSKPLIGGARAATAAPTATTDGTSVFLMANKEGKLISIPALRTLKGKNHVSLTDTTLTTLAAAGGANIFRDAFSITVFNTHASTASLVTIYDNSTAVWVFSLAAGEKWGFTLECGSAFTQATANTAWKIQLGTSTTVEATIGYVDNQ